MTKGRDTVAVQPFVMHQSHIVIFNGNAGSGVYHGMA
jgi:hypothetical protein